MKGSHVNTEQGPSGCGSPETSTKTSANAASAVRSSYRTMQHKLEQKVERTRNLLTHKLPLHNNESNQEPKNPPIMPVSRMRIPGQSDCLPLVDYRDDKHSRTGDDLDDNDDDVDFYPIRKKSSAKHELSDTFSLHEMTICDTEEDDEDATNVESKTAAVFDEDDDEEDDDSQTLEFLSPKLVRGRSWKERCSKMFCCGNSLRL